MNCWMSWKEGMYTCVQVIAAASLCPSYHGLLLIHAQLGLQSVVDLLVCLVRLKMLLQR